MSITASHSMSFSSFMLMFPVSKTPRKQKTKKMDAAKTVLGGRFIALNAYIRKEDLSVHRQMNG